MADLRRPADTSSSNCSSDDHLYATIRGSKMAMASASALVWLALRNAEQAKTHNLKICERDTKAMHANM